MSQKTVLVIEDSPDLAESLYDVFNIQGYKTLIAITGKDGISLALENHPDLILLDIRLPDVSGYEVFQKIKADTWGASADIMVLTASESLDNISKNLGLSIDSVLFKPNLSLNQLVKRVEDRLNGQG